MSMTNVWATIFQFHMLFCCGPDDFNVQFCTDSCYHVGDSYRCYQTEICSCFFSCRIFFQGQCLIHWSEPFSWWVRSSDASWIFACWVNQPVFQTNLMVPARNHLHPRRSCIDAGRSWPSAWEATLGSRKSVNPEPACQSLVRKNQTSVKTQQTGFILYDPITMSTVSFCFLLTVSKFDGNYFLTCCRKLWFFKHQKLLRKHEHWPSWGNSDETVIIRD